VGDFGAGVLVNFIENDIFVEHVNPLVIQLFIKIIPWEIFEEPVYGRIWDHHIGCEIRGCFNFSIVTTFL